MRKKVSTSLIAVTPAILKLWPSQILRVCYENLQEVEKECPNPSWLLPEGNMKICKRNFKNICSVRQERGCSEMEKLEGELFFPRENFPFPRSDSCLAERSEGRQSRSRKRKALEEKKGA